MSSFSEARKTGGVIDSRQPSPTMSPAARQARDRASLRVFSEDRNHVTFSWGPLLGTVWKVETVVSAVEQLRDILHSLAASQPSKKVGVLTIIAADAPLPSTEARSALVNLFRGSAEMVVCSAVVFEGSGFRASAVRSVATGLALLARQPFPHRIFSNTRGAFEWTDSEMERDTGISLGVAQLERDLGLLRSRLPR
jgi:hypothetical protein